MIRPRPLPFVTLGLCAFLSSSCQRKPYPFLEKKEVELTAAEIKKAAAAAAPVSTGSLNIIPGLLPDKATAFLPRHRKNLCQTQRSPRGRSAALHRDRSEVR